jgi:hypothetical protein
MNQPNKLGCSITQLETLTSDKHSNLLGQFPSNEEKRKLSIVITHPRAQITVLHFLYNLRPK